MIKYVLAILIAVGVLCIVPEAEADGCRSVAYVRTPTYHAPYVAPTYGHAAHYYPQYYPVVTAPDYFWSVRDYYRDQLLADAIAFRLLTAGRGGSPEVPKMEQEGVYKGRTMPKASDLHPERSEALPQGVQGLIAGIQAHCAACHTKGGEKGGLVLLDGGKIAALSPEQVGKIMHRVTLPESDPKVMPPRGRTMSAEQRMRFVNLLVSGE